MSSVVPQSLELAAEIAKQNALDSIGRDLVYRFFLSKVWISWAVALVAIVLQLLLCYLFVMASEVTLTTGSDIEYTWQCPCDDDKCRNNDGKNRMCLAILCASSHTVCVFCAKIMVTLFCTCTN